MRIEAPWTAGQVEKLNEYQACGWVHEFTCGNDHGGERTLVATAWGWRCPSCDYTQLWAHEAMLYGAPPNPLALLQASTHRPDADTSGADLSPGRNT